MLRGRMYKGSAVVEMSYLAPVILLVWMAVIFGLFYYHDKGILNGAAYETAIVTSELWNETEQDKQKRASTYFQERIQGKLLFYERADILCEVSTEKVVIQAKAYRRHMLVKVEESAAITHPEEKIRNIKVIKERIEGNIE